MARQSQMTIKHNVVFLFDVDNTLLDNDRVTADLKRRLEADVGSRAGRYWEIFEQLTWGLCSDIGLSSREIPNCYVYRIF